MLTWILPMSTSFTPALTIILETSAMLNITVPALNEETPEVIDSPISTFLVRTTPSIGAMTFEPWNFSGDWTSTFTSGWTVPTSVTLTCTSAISALPILTGALGSCLFEPLAFIATNPATTTTARMMVKIQTFFLRLVLIRPPDAVTRTYNDRQGERFQAVFILSAGVRAAGSEGSKHGKPEC